MVLSTAQAQRKALGLKPAIIMGAVACHGQVQNFSSFWASDESVCVLVMYQLPKIHNFLSPFVSTGTSNSLISPTPFRCCISTFFVQNSRGISRVSLWSLRHRILRLKGHSRVTCGVVLTILGSIVGQNPWTTVVRELHG